MSLLEFFGITVALQEQSIFFYSETRDRRPKINEKLLLADL